ncbi:PPOX class F420-dependent oxidoreductase [Streptomyces longispororuber]|uniref:PPOX class F420-dependent oxidoreductase n=1 Tax=Streptomyces longispororuber TaxID=68230 RepID=UPI00210CB007|nr:PPOX class F420-dependent oxidoreductase [Streptomyces longispororuber]MCQ4206980.1 PPOX class F420-dependent oxidoreductase [Streptomyces longispororuber]
MTNRPEKPQDRPAPSPALAPLVKQYAVLLTTHKKDGTGVGTPVSIAVEGDHAYIRTYGKAWKAKRMRNNPEVEIAPSTLRGAPTGPALRARVRLLDEGSDEARHAAKLLRHKHPIMHGVGVPLAHRVKRDKTLHYEVRVLGE